MKRVLKTIGVVLYLVICLYVTGCMLSKNDYNVTVFGNKSIITVNKDNNFKGYNKGSLLVIKKDLSSLEENDEVFFYNTYNVVVNVEQSTITKIETENKHEYTITLSDDREISSSYVLGNKENVKVIPVIGFILDILESRVGYLILIVLPILAMFLYEIYAVIEELKKNKKVKASKTK